jgi:hypothetical protein
MAFQPNDSRVTTDSWQPLRFSGICHLEIVNTSQSGASFLISTSASGTPSYTIEPYSSRVWDLTNGDDFSVLYFKSAITGNPASFKIAGF